MKRRDFMKALGLLGTSLTIPPVLTNKGLIKPVFAADVSSRAFRNAKAIVAGEINFTQPSSLPTVINIFMYGGPSELAANLTNIAEINASSQNAYPNNLLDTVANGGEITPNGFWASAGGTTMESMIAANSMSIYRTINRIVDDSKAHRTSVFSAQTGGLDLAAPGIGTTLAAVLRVFMPQLFDDPSNTPVMPFVSFEGDSVAYNAGDINDLPLWLRSVSLDDDFANPYQRVKTGPLSTGSTCTFNSATSDCSTLLDNLAASVTAQQTGDYKKLVSSLSKRRELDTFFSDPNSPLNNPANAVPVGVNFTGRFGDTLRAAIVLALENPDTRFITLSTGGLGGWDDHNDAIDRYENRIDNLMNNLQAAVTMLQLGTVGTTPNSNTPRNNVVINVLGEFGRNVNLNGSMGWDHGNNMNLYTLSGSGIAGRQLGQVVGSTKVIGTPGQNRLFTSPADGSIQYEPFAVAATIYKYFGVQNPEALTLDEILAPAGFGAIDG